MNLQSLDEQERLPKIPKDHYWFWCIEADPLKDPFEFFRNTYGHSATQAIVGRFIKTHLDIPNSIKVLGETTPGHIGLR